MMNRCEHIESLFTEYLSGEVPALGRAIVDDHVAECARCRSELAAAREVGRLLAARPTSPCPAHVSEAILRAVEQDAPARWPSWWRGAGAAAVMAAALLLAVLIPGRGPDRAPDDPAAAVVQARQDLLWTLAYTASVIDRSEKRTIAKVLRRVRERTPDNHAEAFPGGRG